MSTNDSGIYEKTKFERDLELGEMVAANGGTIELEAHKAAPNPASPDGVWRSVPADLDALTSLLDRVKFDPVRPPHADAGQDPWEYAASVTGLKTIRAAVDAAAAADAAWRELNADYDAAEAALAEFRRDARTSVLIACNSGKPHGITSGMVKKHRELVDAVSFFDDVLGRSALTRGVAGKPRNMNAAILMDAIIDLSLEDAARLLLLDRSISALQSARHRLGMPPGPWPTNLPIQQALFGDARQRGEQSWMKANPDDRKAMLGVSYALDDWRDQTIDVHLERIRQGALENAA